MLDQVGYYEFNWVLLDCVLLASTALRLLLRTRFPLSAGQKLAIGVLWGALLVGAVCNLTAREESLAILCARAGAPHGVKVLTVDGTTARLRVDGLLTATVAFSRQDALALGSAANSGAELFVDYRAGSGSSVGLHTPDGLVHASIARLDFAGQRVLPLVAHRITSGLPAPARDYPWPWLTAEGFVELSLFYALFLLAALVAAVALIRDSPGASPLPTLGFALAGAAAVAVGCSALGGHLCRVQLTDAVSGLGPHTVESVSADRVRLSSGTWQFDFVTNASPARLRRILDSGPVAVRRAAGADFALVTRSGSVAAWLAGAAHGGTPRSLDTPGALAREVLERPAVSCGQGVPCPEPARPECK